MAGSQISLLQTEKPHAQAKGLDLLSGVEVLTILHSGQVAATNSVSAAIPALEKGAEAMANAIRSGGNLVYAAAGSSGLMGLADGLEIPPTFGIPTSRISILRAGGLEDMAKPKGEAEDDEGAAKRDAAGIGPDDCVICLAASGNTVYPVTIMNIAKAHGATTIGLSNNDGTLLIVGADIPVFLPTPPEIIAGSTRLGDLKAPLRAIRNYGDFLNQDLGETLDEDNLSYLHGLLKATKEADDLIEDLLNYSQVSTTKSSVETVDLGVFVPYVISGLSIPEGVDLQFSGDWPVVKTAPTLIKQIIQNLVTNAVKFGPNENNRVELDCQMRGENDFEISVTDHGIGIESRFFEQIYQIFKRLHTKAEYEGTGIGLAIVKKAASRLSGHVRVESQLGKGNTFFVSLPLNKIEDTQ